MKLREGLLLSLAFSLLFGACNTVRTESRELGLVEGVVQVNGTSRHYLKYVPSSAQSGSALVVLLHGGSQSMREIFYPKQTGTLRWLTLARRDGFVLIAPNGTNPTTGDAAGNEQNWNDLRSDGGLRDSQADDVSFILSLIDEMEKQHGVNPKRVYVTGASNGGMMTFRLLIEQPKRFAAGAAFIANLPATEVAIPTTRTPILICNGTDDPLVPDGGGTVAKNRGQVRSTQATVNFWLKVNGGNALQKSSRELPDTDLNDGSRLRESSYRAPDGSMPVLYIAVEGGGHYMPSSSAGELGAIVKRILGRHQNRDAEGADLAWEFMRAYQR